MFLKIEETSAYMLPVNHCISVKLSIFLTMFLWLSSMASAGEIIDMADRKVKLPSAINRIYATHQSGIVIIHTLCLDKLVGWCFKPLSAEREFIPTKYIDLPILGTIGGNNTANREQIMVTKPDVIIMATYIAKDTRELADNVQWTTNIPVVMIDMNVKRIPEAYRLLGRALNIQERAERLAAYSEKVISLADSSIKSLKEHEKITVYYAQGGKGLTSSPAGSSHGEIIDIVGGKNVVGRTSASDNRIGVNMEQILSWNPKVVLLADRIHSAYPTMKFPVELLKSLGGSWRFIDAVKDNRVYFVPCKPYNWLDMPPSVNRIIGILWLGNLLYPQRFKVDIRKEIKEFFNLFYDFKLTDKKLDEILFVTGSF